MEDTRKIIKLPGLEPEPEQPEKLNNAVPPEVCLKWLMKEQGKQLSYIEELEDTIKDQRNKITELESLTADERKEMKRGVYYSTMRNRMQDLEKKIGQLRRDNEDLIQRLVKSKIKTD